MNLNPYITFYTKQKPSKWIIDLYVQLKTVRLLKENTGENPSDLRLGKDFLDTTSETLFVKENIGKY